MAPVKAAPIFAVAGIALAGFGMAMAGAALEVHHLQSGERALYADADQSATALEGAHIYMRQCAACHGRRLQGQPFWQLADQDKGRRAPALDATGRAWMRSDGDLFAIVKYGRYPSASTGPRSHMPAFQRRLDDAAIEQVLAYVRSRWPTGPRTAQAMLNPGRDGMPRDAASTDWTFPGTCVSPDEVGSTGSRP